MPVPNGFNDAPFPVNQYPARCAACSQFVPKNTGALMGRTGPNGRWRVLHTQCVPEDEWSAAAEQAWQDINDCR